MHRADAGYGESMNPLLSTVLRITEGSGGSLGVGGGVLIIVGIVVSLVLLALLGHWLVNRYGHTKRESLDRESQGPGRVGRGGKRREP